MRVKMLKARTMTAAAVMIVVVGFLTTSSTAAKLYKVGDEKGWNQNVNYTQWSEDKEFNVGEWLIFNFDKRYYTVLEVNKTSYENCNDQVFMTNITKGGRDVFELKEARPYYFLSSGGYCFHGMKLALVVREPPSPSPAEAPAASSASPNALNSGGQMSLTFLIVVCIALVMKFSW